MKKWAIRNWKSLIYKIFLVVLLVGMHGEYQFGSFKFLGSSMQYSSVELVIVFSILFLSGYLLCNKMSIDEVFREKTLFWILCFFCLSLVLSTIFARYKVEAVKYDIRIMSTIVLFYLLLQFLFKARLKEASLIVLNVVGIGVCLICILRYFNIAWVNDTFSMWGTGSRRVYSASIFQHNNVFGNWLALLIFVTAGQFKDVRRKAYRILLGGYIGLFCITLHLTLSRSALVAFACTLCLYLWIKRSDTVMLLKGGVIIAVIFYVIGVNVLTTRHAQRRLVETRTNILSVTSDFKKSAGRFGLYKSSLKMFKACPLFGVGLNNFKNIFCEFGEVSKGGHGRHNAHNQYLNVLAEQGIFGFTVFMLFVGYLVRLAINNIKNGGNEFYALAIFAYLIGALFDYLWYDYSFIFMFWLVVILNLIERRNLGIQEPGYSGIRKLRNWGFWLRLKGAGKRSLAYCGKK